MSTERPSKPLLLLGPTAVGKSQLAVELAWRLGGEIISADARAVYRELTIGTAKPSPELRARVAHHLLDIRAPTERYDVMEFRRDVQRKIAELLKQRKLPIVVGGSTLYLAALTGSFFAGPKADLQLRKRLEAEPQGKLRERLEQCDPAAAQRIHPNDKVRTVRALEVYELTGLPITRWQRESQVGFPYEFTKIGLWLERKMLYERINARVDEMLINGLCDEAKALREKLTPEMPAYRTIGYEELFEHLDGKLSYEEAVQLIKKHSREYAKRQLIYFKRESDIHWVDVTGKSFEQIVAETLRRLDGY